ncbi:hypothetical protein KRMM14A1259_25450 [Krasilnikovia sp. MM14-A1259]
MPIGPLSLVTLTTLSNEPIAVEMNPVGTCAAMSLPLPTTRGRGPRWGGCGISGALAHRTARQLVRGNWAVKHPRAGRGVWAIVFCQSRWLGCAGCAAPALDQDADTKMVTSAMAPNAMAFFLRMRLPDLMASPHEPWNNARGGPIKHTAITASETMPALLPFRRRPGRTAAVSPAASDSRTGA